MKRVLVLIALVAILFTGSLALAQTPTPEPTPAPAPAPAPTPAPSGGQNLQFGPFTLGMDNAYLVEPGKSGGVYVGTGTDLATVSFLNGWIPLTGRVSILFPVSGATNVNAPVTAFGVNYNVVDVLKKANINFNPLVSNLTAAIGPLVGYDVTNGRAAVGMSFQLKWNF